MSSENKKQFAVFKPQETSCRRDLGAVLFLALAFFLPVRDTYASIVENLQSKIAERTAEIENLEKEISQYRVELENIGSAKSSLQNEIARIDVTRKKLAADIKVTETKISATNLNIERLSLEIGGKEISIEKRRDAIGESVRRTNEIDQMTLAELVLHSENLSDFWNDVEQIRQFSAQAETEAQDLKILKTGLESDKTDVERERATLVLLRTRLSDQKTIADNEKKVKDKLLTQTKNKESGFRSLLAEKESLRRKFERELLDLESELRITIDPASLPPSQKGILSWPVVPVKVTQTFGDTAFARSGAYNGKGHNGTDFGAPVGTPVKAALSGTVVGVGDTDQFPKCYSYGKWVLIKHDNGLSTLYAHLSLIRAFNGQRVDTGDTIGYSGNTGYSTGPHLHFTVYATQGVEIVRLGDIKKITNCANARIPVAPLNAYLDPMSYL